MGQQVGLAYRGSIRFKLLGEEYELMKPSLLKQVFVLVKEPPKEEVKLDENKSEVAKLLEGSGFIKDKEGNSVALKEANLTDYIKSFQVTHLIKDVVPEIM